MTVAMQERRGNALFEAIASRFVESRPGQWFPRAAGTPLVRVVITGGLYRIDRRRSEDTEWVQLVEGVVGDFDAESFATWADSFELVATN